MLERLPSEFRPVYRYRVELGNIVDMEVLDAALWQEQGVVYANVCEGREIRIGKTDGQLSKRILGHVNSYFPRGTNPPYKKYVEGKVVTIFAFKPTPVRLFDIEIPIHTSVEAALIGQFKRADGTWFVKKA